MDFQKGCQTITWGEGQGQRLPAVFDEVAAAGFEGVEVGFRHLKPNPPEQVRAWLEASGLELVASHIGGNLANAGQAGQERGLLDEALDYLGELGCGRLMYSGLRWQDAAQFERDLDALGRAATVCREHGVQLLYHNHDWEFADGGRVMEALLADAGPDLGFCPDVGWIVQGGADPIAFLERAKPRLGAVHFKDFAAGAADNPFVLLGQGRVPFPAVADWLRRHRPGLWVIAEQDRADVPPGEAARANGAYLRRVLTGEGT